MENWDSPILSTLRGYSSSDSISAFTLLLVSEVGHRYDLFDKYGWSILQTLLQADAIPFFLKASYEIFRNFFLNSVPDIFSSANFSKIAQKFNNLVNLESRKNEIISFMRKALEKNEDVAFSIKFFCNFFFANHSWTNSRIILEFLDELAKILYQTPYASDLLTILSAQYRSFVFSYEPANRAQSAYYRFEYPRSEKYSSSLVQATNGNLFSKGKFVADGLWYFLLFAFSVEVFAEREVRSRVGAELAAGQSLEKPTNQISTVRIAELLLEIPFDHPTCPVFFQVSF